VVCRLDCLVIWSTTVVSPAKTAQPIEMPFGLWARVGSWNHILDRFQLPVCENAIFRGKDMPGHAWWHSAMSCANSAEPIDMPLGLWTLVCRMKHVLHRGILAPPGEYDWTVRLWQRCGFMSNYFDHLLDRIARTTHVDAVYCYRPSISVLCLFYFLHYSFLFGSVRQTKLATRQLLGAR